MDQRCRWNENCGARWEFYQQLQLSEHKMTALLIVKVASTPDGAYAIRPVSEISMFVGYGIGAEIDRRCCKDGVLAISTKARMPFLQLKHILHILPVDLWEEESESTCNINQKITRARPKKAHYFQTLQFV